MHLEALEYLRSVCPAETDETIVIELGSRDVNGSPRQFFPRACANHRYIGVDIRPGPGVDIVTDAAVWDPPVHGDVVICCEVFEHTAAWREIIKTMRKCARPGATVIVTAAGPERAPHSAIDGEHVREGEHYENISALALNDALEEAGFIEVKVTTNGLDVRATARRGQPADVVIEKALSGIRKWSNDPPGGTWAPKEDPLISLCLIVKNGERTLPALFDSIEGMFDEIVLVDTGSTDKTREMVWDRVLGGMSGGDIGNYYAWLEDEVILRGGAPLEPGCGVVHEHGVKRDGKTTWILGRFAWCDDFAAARNFSFSLAHGRWRMFLDADDVIEYRGTQTVIENGVKRLGRVDFRAICRHLDKNQPQYNCVSFPYLYIENVVEEEKIRLFRWADGWEWRDPVHEQPHQKHGRRTIKRIGDAVVVHDKTQTEHDNSIERNSRIMMTAMQNKQIDDETYARMVFHHAVEMRIRGRFDEADRYFAFVEDTMEQTTFWLEARRHRVQIWAQDIPEGLDRALELAGGMWAHIPDLKDGPLYVGWVHALRRQFIRAAHAFDRVPPSEGVPIGGDTSSWLNEGAMPAAKALAYAHVGRIDEARAALGQVRVALRNHAYVHDFYMEADKHMMKIACLRRTLEFADALLWDAQPFEAIQALQHAPMNVRDLPQVTEKIRFIQRKLPHMEGFEEYKRIYGSIPDEKYHNDERHDVLTTERAQTFLDWVRELDEDGPEIHVLCVGSQDALIEEEAMTLSERINVCLVDIAPQASKAATRLKEAFPGRVRTHRMERSLYDWCDDDMRFDAVMCFEVIEHVPSPLSMIDTIHKALKPNGQLFLSTPSAERWVEPHLTSEKEAPVIYAHVHAFTPASLRADLWPHFSGSIVEGRDGTLVFSGQRTASHPTWVSPSEIEIYVPGTPNPFDAISPETGFLGGSEEAVVRLSRALTKLGANVTVYAPEKRRDGNRLCVHEGVLYRGVEEFDPGRERSKKDAVLFWRCPQVLFQTRELVQKNGDRFDYKKMLWLHDSSYQAKPEEYDVADHILALSEHHMRCLVEDDGAYMDKMTPFPNGIDEDDFPPLMDNEERIAGRVIYASSPERGLSELLAMWPAVMRATNNAATLDIFYDWTAARRANPIRIDRLHQRIAELNKEFSVEGIIYHGGVDQPTLHKAFRKASVWAYPNTGKVETYCITARKAQASGCWPVTTTAGAIPEVVERHGVCVPEGNWSLFEAQLIDALKNPPSMTQRRAMQEYALQFTWASVAKKLLSLLEADALPPRGEK